MKEVFIENIGELEVVTSFFMIKSTSIRVGANKKEFWDVTLGDKTGEISAKKWDIGEEADLLGELKEGDIVKIRAQVTEWNGTKQLKITKVRKSLPNDNLIINDYIKAAPEPAEEMYDYIFEKAESIEDVQLRELCTNILLKEKERLMYYPAATKNHHAQMAGLLYHVKRMLMAGEGLCQVYTILDRSLVVAGVILHDMQKLNEIMSNELGIANEYSFEGNMLGHLVLGVRELEKEMEKIGFSREKAVMVEHMILAHHYEPEFGSPKRPMFPEAEILHYLDVMDARIFDMEDALRNTEPGSFSDKVWTLENRKIYKRKIDE
ncbi:MAG: OB-fold nucleic acid binding domain-containing protein [Eubacterium sp.]|nr:OB-fold nucleic acid binding domain-containing protein [Eubacterium sp.]